MQIVDFKTLPNVSVIITYVKSLFITIVYLYTKEKKTIYFTKDQMQIMQKSVNNYNSP